VLLRSSIKAKMEGHMPAPITNVLTGSIAEEMGIEAGDLLISVNGQEIFDILDYRFYSQDSFIIVEVEKKNRELWSIEIEKDFDEELGLIFDSYIFDKMKVCKNRCIFCFVDQLPKHMRKTLYIKDDDYRFSFLYGNFITLTNLSEKDWHKITSMRLSPLYVSVHCTNPGLRSEMLHNSRAATIKQDLQRLKDAGIEVHTQIVLCPDINDDLILKQSIEELSEYYPSVQSVGIVPVGLTGYRKKLRPLRTFSVSETISIIQMVEKYQRYFRSIFNKGFVYLADEFYIQAGQELPTADYYDDYDQIENGIGLGRTLLDELKDLEGSLPHSITPKKVNLLTGYSAIPILNIIVERLNKIEGLEARIIPVKNNFFGGNVSVTGLLTGSDIISALHPKYIGQKIIIPAVLLQEENDILLDGISLNDIELKTGTQIFKTDGTVRSLVDTIFNC